MSKKKPNLSNICKQFPPLMKDYLRNKSNSAYMETINKVKMYINDDGTYFSIDIVKVNYNIHCRDNGEASCDSPEYTDKIELIIMDALVAALNDIEKSAKKQLTKYNNEITSMISGIVRRRKIETPKDFLEVIALPEKVYI